MHACFTLWLLWQKGSGSRNVLHSKKATYWIFGAFVCGGFIAVVARGNPRGRGLSPSLSQHFQYHTIHSHSSLSTGVSISFLYVLYFGLQTLGFPSSSSSGQPGIITTLFQEDRAGGKERTLAVKFPGEVAGTPPPPTQRKLVLIVKHIRKNKLLLHGVTPWKLIISQVTSMFLAVVSF